MGTGPKTAMEVAKVVAFTARGEGRGIEMPTGSGSGWNIHERVNGSMVRRWAGW